MSSDRETAAAELPKHYVAKEVEAKWLAAWEGTCHSVPDGEKKPYTIVIPPPNVTGILHMGHALNNTLQDVLIRHARMKGLNPLWMPGTDHAGIATQNVVEKSLQNEGLHREDLGRERFISRVWDWKEKFGSTIINQLKRLGCSCDWERERFTMDEGLSRAVREVFVRLYDDGLIYRGRRLINWCVRCHTALADDEVEHEDHAGKLWHIKYQIKDQRGHLVVATTRPETMLGDTAVAVHPDDSRYKDLIGQMVILPVMEREIPIIADEFVDPKFGTGVVKVTPAHDPNDYECGLRHELPQIIVIGPKGKMTEEAGKYAGLDRFRCRERLVEELEQEKLLEKTEEHNHAVGQCYRCDSVIEPHLSEQWFVRMRPLADKAIAASREEKIRFHPPRWEKVYLSWLENVRDWCISRQIWWGHRIPVWYCQACGELIVPMEDPEKCPKCDSTDLEQDPDVLDTWFSSALWPFSTFGWPEKNAELEYYYPTDVLVTARDIIYFWVARMVMMGLHFMDEVPFPDVYINGTILDEHGARMSKSKENGIDPIVLIEGGTQRRFGKDFTYESYGADSVRYTLCALTTDGQDIKLSPQRFEMGRNFINKVWNASRFVMMRLATIDLSNETVTELRFEDRWILSRLARAVKECDSSLERYRFHDYTKAVYDFTWGDFCDWYVEMVKPRLFEEGPDQQVAGRVLSWVLDQILRLLHPATPFFTEELWSRLAAFAPTRGLAGENATPAALLQSASWPVAGAIDDKIESSMTQAQEVIRAVRNIRAKFNIPPRAPLSVVVSASSAEMETSLMEQTSLIASQTRAEEVKIGAHLEKPPQSAAEVLKGIQVFVPLSGLMDVDLEKKRVANDLGKKVSSLGGLKRKLQNQDFLSKAPADIVEREENRREELLQQIRELEDLAATLEEK